MEEDTVVALPRPGSGVMDDPLLAVLREGARRMLTQAIEAEVEAFLAAHRACGSIPRRDVSGADRPGSWTTGSAPLGAQRTCARAPAPDRDRPSRGSPTEAADRGRVADSAPIRFTSAVLPAYLRRTRNLEELVPWLYRSVSPR